jgi:glutamate synthase domain-containing protein 3
VVIAGETEQNLVEIDAQDTLTAELNAKIREAAASGAKKIILQNVCGQRYIGTRIYPYGPVEIEVYGTPGNDLGAFIDGHSIVVHGNAQDGTGNTMNSGEIIVNGRAGDILGMSMRGGEIFVRDSVGYRVGIHMKEYGSKRPVLVIGGTAQDFLGEYTAGGIIILLGLQLDGKVREHRMNFIGTGMHGGTIYIRGELQKHQLGKQVQIEDLDYQDQQILDEYISKYAEHFNIPKKQLADRNFTKIQPTTKRPYGHLYTH